jgi:hypothetical protein
MTETENADKRITDASELVGKTIERITGVGHDRYDLAIRFTDGSYVVFDLDHDSTCDEPIYADIDRCDLSPWMMLGLGLITPEEKKARDEAHRASLVAAQEARDRENYERLKARFEQPTTP